MTTDVEPEGDHAGSPAERRSRRRPGRLVLAVVVGVAAILGIPAAALVAWDASYEGRILPGVHVGGVDLSGLDREAADRALSAGFDFGSGRLVLSGPESGEAVIPYADFGRRLDVGPIIDEAMRAGRSGGVLERAVAEVRQAVAGTGIQPRLAYDATALAQRIAVALGPMERPPVNASIAVAGDGLVTTPAAAGCRVDAASVTVAAVAAVERSEAPAEVVVQVEGIDVPPAVGDAAVQIAQIRGQRLIRDVVVTFGKKRWTIDAATVRGWVSFTGTGDGSVRPAVDGSLIAPSLAAAGKGVVRKPVSATFLAGRNGRVVGAVAGRDGRRLDTDATVASVMAELERRSNGAPPTAVPVRTMPVAPELTTEAAIQTAPLMEKLGTWTTWFPISDRNYFGANIWLPARLINGTVLAPGRSFDWWRAVGPISTARGFGPGGVIMTDHTDPTGALGGGMCSSSTTLFNAAFRAGLRMGSRSNHRYYITRYPLGLDATVSKMGGGTQTMSFTNDTRHPILIRGIKIRGSGGKGYVRYEIWGVRDGRTVTISRPTVANVRLATTKLVSVNTLPHGRRNQTEFPSNGMDVTVTRTVRAADGHVIHRETYRSHYQLWNGRIEVGI